MFQFHCRHSTMVLVVASAVSTGDGEGCVVGGGSHSCVVGSFGRASVGAPVLSTLCLGKTAVLITALVEDPLAGVFELPYSISWPFLGFCLICMRCPWRAGDSVSSRGIPLGSWCVCVSLALD